MIAYVILISEAFQHWISKWGIFFYLFGCIHLKKLLTKNNYLYLNFNNYFKCWWISVETLYIHVSKFGQSNLLQIFCFKLHCSFLYNDYPWSSTFPILLLYISHILGWDHLVIFFSFVMSYLTLGSKWVKTKSVAPSKTWPTYTLLFESWVCI